MKFKSFFLIVSFILLINVCTSVVFAYTAPDKYSAPQNFAVVFDKADSSGGFKSFTATVSAPEDVRKLLKDANDSNSVFTTDGGFNLLVYLQMDIKTDSGEWHYSSEWDTDTYCNNQGFTIGLPMDGNSQTSSATYEQEGYLSKLNIGDNVPGNISYFNSHEWTFRSRLIISYQMGNESIRRFSEWSNSFKYTNKSAEDTMKLINHAPVLNAAKVSKYADGLPYMDLVIEKPHYDIEKLASISGNKVKIEIWAKTDKFDWKSLGERDFKDTISFDVAQFFPAQDNYDEAKYSVKVRYSFNNAFYPQAGKSGVIYSPFSNEKSNGMAGWSDANKWALKELEEASVADLIPDILIGANMMKPITREEFCELAVLLYEKVTGKEAEKVSLNPFNDTTNPQILKAVKLGITRGTKPDTFSPKIPISREQCAAMLFRAMKAINPEGDFSVEGVKDFIDQKLIAKDFVQATKYMSKIGVIKGFEGKFMPRATTSVEEAKGYGMATREAAIIMSLRIYKEFGGSLPQRP